MISWPKNSIIQIPSESNLNDLAEFFREMFFTQDHYRELAAGALHDPPIQQP
jgi:hypothetical protein